MVTFGNMSTGYDRRLYAQFFTQVGRQYYCNMAVYLCNIPFAQFRTRIERETFLLILVELYEQETLNLDIHGGRLFKDLDLRRGLWYDRRTRAVYTALRRTSFPSAVDGFYARYACVVFVVVVIIFIEVYWGVWIIIFIEVFMRNIKFCWRQCDALLVMIMIDRIDKFFSLEKSVAAGRYGSDLYDQQGENIIEFWKILFSVEYDFVKIVLNLNRLFIVL